MLNLFRFILFLNILLFYGCKISIKKSNKIIQDSFLEPPSVNIIGSNIVKSKIKLLIKGKSNSNIIINNKVVSNIDIDGQKILEYNLVGNDGYKIINIELESSSGVLSKPIKITCIKDTTAPKISLIGSQNIYIRKNSKFIDPFVEVVDNISKKNKILIDRVGSIDTQRVGEYLIKYIAVDEAKNRSSIYRKVNVVDIRSFKQGKFKIENDEVTIRKNNKIVIDATRNDMVEPGNFLKIEYLSKEPINGVAKIVDNKIEYIPNSNFVGDDIIKYVAVDIYGNKDEGSILIHIVNNRINFLFNSYIDKLVDITKRRLKNGDMYVLYDMQTYMQSSVIYADRYHDKEMLQKLLELVSIPFEPEYIGEDELWLDYVTLKDYKDHDPYLATTQFFSLLTRVLSACERNGVSTKSFRRPKIVDGHRYDNLKIIEDHLEKFSRVMPKNFKISKDLSMKLRFHNPNDRIFIRIMSKKGWRYLYYNLENSSRGKYNENYIHIGLGSDVILDEWYKFKRDFAADLKRFESDNEFLYADKIEFQTKDSIDIKDLFVDGFIFNRSKIIPYNFPVNEGFRRVFKVLDSSNGETTLEEDSSYVKIKAYSNDTLCRVYFYFRNAYQLWDAPRDISDKDMFIYQSLLQYDDYTKSIGREFNPSYKEKMIKGLYKNIIDNFTYDGEHDIYNFATFKNDFYDHIYSGYGIETTKDMMFNDDGRVKVPPKIAVTSWDVSHGRRINWLIETSLKFGDKYSVVIPKEIINGYIRNLSLNVCIGDESNPHFTIYLNGRHGWYRVNYLDRPFYGFSPDRYPMDYHFVSGSYAIFSSQDEKLKKWIDNWVDKNYLLMSDYHLLDYYTSKAIKIY